MMARTYSRLTSTRVIPFIAATRRTDYADDILDRQAMLVSGALHTLLWISTLFNFALCFVDTNIIRLSAREVIATEAVVLAFVATLPFALLNRRAGRWDLLLAILLVNWLALSILRGFPDPKLLRDVAIIPVFIIAGLVSREQSLHANLFWLHIFILLVALWEAFSPASFVSVFSVAQYFEHTRGLEAEDWWISNGLYLSSVRPEARFLLPQLPIHRLSSVFLEPVSLGNYVVISTIWLTVFWRHLPRWMVLYQPALRLTHLGIPKATKV